MTKKFFVKVAVLLMTLLIFSSAAFAARHTSKIGILGYLGTDEEQFQKSVDDFRKFLSPLVTSRIAWGSVPEIEDTINFLQSFRDNKYVIKFYDSLVTMLAAIQSERIDEISLPENTALYVMRNDPAFKILLAINMPSALALGFRENDTALCEDLNKVLSAMKQDGTLKAFEEKHIKLAEKPTPVEFSKFDGADTIKVAVTGDMPPIDYISESGEPAGYNTAVLSEIGRRLKKNIELINIEAGARSAALSSGRVDIVFWYRTTKGINIPKEAGLEGENPLNSVVKDTTEGIILSVPYYEWDKYLILAINE